MDNFDRYGKNVTASFEVIVREARGSKRCDIDRSIRVMERFMKSVHSRVKEGDALNNFDDEVKCGECGEMTVLKPKGGFQYDRIVTKCCGTRDYKGVEHE